MFQDVLWVQGGGGRARNWEAMDLFGIIRTFF